LLAILAISLQVVGWGRAGRVALAVAGSIGEVALPLVRVLWPVLVALAVAGLVTRRGRRLLARMRTGIRWSWLVAALALVVLGLVVLSLLVFPSYLVQRSLKATGTGTLGAPERLKAENDARTTLLQGVAGLVLVVGAGATWRQIQINREGQITERFSKAIDHLGESGDGKVDVRLGGIYALERIAENSKDDRATIAEILTAFVRGHSTWSDPDGDAVSSEPAQQELADLRVRAPDIQGAITVLGRRALPSGRVQPLWLTSVDLRKARLVDANLEGAILRGAHLEGADLRGAHLEGADLVGAHLEGAVLWFAHLEDADLSRAHLEEAQLFRAHLDRADLRDAHLEGARTEHTHLKKADLRGANLEVATRDSGGESILYFADLERALADKNTSWPDGFDWRTAGVRSLGGGPALRLPGAG
jgi:uncharacterized protein YjbI with pentapeptide repeats